MCVDRELAPRHREGGILLERRAQVHETLLVVAAQVACLERTGVFTERDERRSGCPFQRRRLGDGAQRLANARAHALGDFVHRVEDVAGATRPLLHRKEREPGVGAHQIGGDHIASTHRRDGSGNHQRNSVAHREQLGRLVVERRVGGELHATQPCGHVAGAHELDGFGLCQRCADGRSHHGAQRRVGGGRRELRHQQARIFPNGAGPEQRRRGPDAELAENHHDRDTHRHHTTGDGATAPGALPREVRRGLDRHRHHRRMHRRPARGARRRIQHRLTRRGLHVPGGHDRRQHQASRHQRDRDRPVGQADADHGGLRENPGGDEGERPHTDRRGQRPEAAADRGRKRIA